MYLDFEKWHGCKNDFVIIWLSDSSGEVVLNSIVKKAPSICARDGSGVGADGILVLHTKLKSDLEPYQLTIINKDASIAKNCGNGVRVAALSIFIRHRENQKKLPEIVGFDVAGSYINSRFLPKTMKHRYPYVAVELGEVRSNGDLPWFDVVKSRIEGISESYPDLKLEENFSCHEIGNPHVVFRLEKVERSSLMRLGNDMQTLEGMDGINVHLVAPKVMESDDLSQSNQVLDSQIGDLYSAMSWERGVGPTQACGTGAGAVAVSVYNEGESSRQDWVGIDMPGGRLFLQQNSEEDPVTLVGPGELVYQGILEL